MKVLSNSLLLAMILGGPIATATASSVIQSVTFSGAGLGSFSLDNKDEIVDGLNTLNLSKTFSSVNPITLTFTVGHSEETTPYDVFEKITNGTNSPFTNLHLQITEPVDALTDGVVFTSLDPNDYFGPIFPGFTLDSPSQTQPPPYQPTGPRDLNFTGELAAGSEPANLYFSLSMPDPGAGNTYTFTLTQTPTVGVIPEPDIYALMLAGAGIIGFVARCRKQNV